MKPNISEFSYGYALTEELIKSFGAGLTAAPVFPSLYQEGKKGGGWDVKLQKGGIPLFIQFKLSHCMIYASAKERKSGHFSSKYYRMHIRPKSQSKQHELLLELEGLGNEVYYSAPGFHQPNELNTAYLNNDVRANSIWVKPTDIGVIADSHEHYIAFQLPKKWYFCSQPKPIYRDLTYDTFLKSLLTSSNERAENALTRDTLEDLTENMATIAGRMGDIDIPSEAQSESLLSNRHPIERVAYYASIYLDCQLVIIQKDDVESTNG